MYGVKLAWCDKLCYLDTMLIINNDTKVDVSLRIQKFTAAVCALLRGRIISFENVYVNVMVTKCMPILFYGIDCLHLDCNSLNRLSVVWNTALDGSIVSQDMNICVLIYETVIQCHLIS